jgi:serine/threonine protein kinase
MKAEPICCPSAADLELLLAEQLSSPQLDSVETHLEGCASCHERLEQLIATAQATTKSSETQHPTEPQPPHEFLSRLKQMPPPPMESTGPAVLIAEQPTPDKTRAAGPVDALKQQRLGKYEILETLGRGNMGVVYKARHTELGKVVALKVLPSSESDEAGIARFKNEARAVGRLDHPNIVTAHDAGRDEGVHYLVMSFVDGVDLARLVQQHGRLSIPDACELIRQAAVGLQHAYERGLVHRDIKPSNLMLARNGVVNVLDLGIARLSAGTVATERLTATGMLLGTADYLAPEQWDNPHAVDTRADVYSLGCSLYHLLAGHPPFSGLRYPSVMAKMRGHLDTPAPPIQNERPEVPDPLAAVLDRMLSKNPADRFSTPGEVAAALQPFTGDANLVALPESSVADGPTRRDRSRPDVATDTDQSVRTSTGDRSNDRGYRRPAWRLTRRHKLAVGLATVGVALAIALAVWLVQHDPQPSTDPVKTATMTVRQYRGESATLVGDISAKEDPIYTDDSVRVSIKLNAPGTCYLLAFNPDGKEQLCYPEDPELPAVFYPENRKAKAMTLSPSKGAELKFPEKEFFEPGIQGLQVFVLLASAKPLPPYAKWRAQIGDIPWKETSSYRQTARWEFDGQEYNQLPKDRGERVKRGGAPRAFQDLCDFLRNCQDVQVMRALAFPVTKK